MAKLEVRLFGAFEVILDSVPVQFRTNKARALLVHLAMNVNQPVARTALTHLLWQDVPHSLGLGNLRKTLSHLRKNLRDAEHKFFTVTREYVQFNTTNHYVFIDARRFEILFDHIQSHKHVQLERCYTCTQHLQEAIELYRGEYLEGFIIESGNFIDLQILSREQFHRQSLIALGVLGRHALQTGMWHETLRHARQHIKQEPWSEEALQLMMQAFVAAGEPESAVLEYERFAERLHSSLGVMPSADIQALVTEIQQGAADDGEQHLHRTNLLPAYFTFFGRTRELREVSALLIDPTVRWVSLIGEGGIGKTTLAETVGRRMLPTFPDGVWFVSCAHLLPQDLDQSKSYANELLASAIAQSVDLPRSGADNSRLFEQLVAYFRDKQLLLVLDNLEQLAAAGLIEQLLEKLPTLKLLTTSRRIMLGDSEYCYPLQGLRTQMEAGDNMPESVALFYDYAARVTGDFAYSKQTNHHEIAKLCEFLAGNPLGIQLTATQANRFRPENMLAEISANMNVLASNMRDAEPRHRSMRATYDFSWQILSQDKQNLLAQLAVIDPPFDVAAAHAVAGATAQSVAYLAEQSLVQQNNSEYEMHSLLRTYSLEKLAEIEQGKLQHEAKLRHSHYFLQQLANAEATLLTTDAQSLLNQLQSGLPNFNAAWRYALQHEYIDLLQDAAPALEQLALQLNIPRDLGVLFEVAVASGRKWQTENRRGRENIDRLNFYLAKMQLHAANIRIVRWHLRSAERMLHETISFVREIETPNADCHAIVATAYLGLGKCAMRQGNVTLAQQQIERAFAILDVHDDGRIRAHTLALDAQLKELGEDISVAESQCRKAIELAREIQDDGLLVDLYKRLGKILMDAGDFEAAKPYYRKAQTLSDQLGNAAVRIALTREIAINLIDEGQYHEAKAYCKQLEIEAKRISHVRYQLDAKRLFGQINGIIGYFDQAEQAISETLAVARKEGWTSAERMLTRRLSNVYFAAGKYQLACETAKKAYDGALQANSLHEVRSAAILYGNALLELGNVSSARDKFVQAVERSTKRAYWQLEPAIGMLYCNCKLGNLPTENTLQYVVDMVLNAQQLYSLWQPAKSVLHLYEMLLEAGCSDLAHQIDAYAKQAFNARIKGLKVSADREQYLSANKFNVKLFAQLALLEG